MIQDEGILPEQEGLIPLPIPSLERALGYTCEGHIRGLSARGEPIPWVGPSFNGLIRRYFPKGTDFQLVSQGAVNEVVIRLDGTPRKVLGDQTPSEVFTAHIMQGVRIYS
jgi:hypothetical protein